MGRVEFPRDLLVSWKFDKEKNRGTYIFPYSKEDLWVACLHGHIATQN